MKNIHGHDRDNCAECARQRAKWGPADHCGRTHELSVGDKVRIGKGKVVYEVVSVLPSQVNLHSVSDREKARRIPLRRHVATVTIGEGHRVWSSSGTIVDRDIACLTLVEEA